MKSIHLVVVGKNKDKAFSLLEKEYQKRLKKMTLKVHELKHHDSKEKNDSQVIQKITSLSGRQAPFIVLLDERGKSFRSKEFSLWLFEHLESFNNIFFVIGGAEGHGEEMMRIAKDSIRLSDFTLPHRMARTLIIEQIYRAESLHLGHPYHK